MVRSPHGFKTIPPKPELGKVIWKEKLRLRETMKNFTGFFRGSLRLLDGRVGRCIHDTEDDALVFSWRELDRRKRGQQDEHQNRKAPKRDPDRIDRRPMLQSPIEFATVEIADAIENAIADPGHALFLPAGAQKFRRHHR